MGTSCDDDCQRSLYKVYKPMRALVVRERLRRRRRPPRALRYACRSKSIGPSPGVCRYRARVARQRYNYYYRSITHARTRTDFRQVRNGKKLSRKPIFRTSRPPRRCAVVVRTIIIIAFKESRGAAFVNNSRSINIANRRST